MSVANPCVDQGLEEFFVQAKGVSLLKAQKKAGCLTFLLVLQCFRDPPPLSSLACGPCAAPAHGRACVLLCRWKAEKAQKHFRAMYEGLVGAEELSGGTAAASHC